MAARLDLEEHQYHGYRMGWWDEENDIEGDLTIGEKLVAYDDDDSEQRGEIEEHNYVTDKLEERCPPDSCATCGTFYWQSKTKAIRALRIARTLRKQWKNKDRPWPEWAIKASAEGWKPAKGWKP